MECLKLLGRFPSKAQSAMEYLMTYGWAILVIAVVLGVLYSLGIFNPSNFAPKAQPGSCQVFRPNGPGTNYDINLEGICSGELPEYISTFNQQLSPNSYIDAGSVVTQRYINDASDVTVVLWANVQSTIPSGWPKLFETGVISMYVNPGNTLDIGSGVYAGTPNNNYYNGAYVDTGAWSQIALVYNGTSTSGYNFLEYINGHLQSHNGVQGALGYGSNELYFGPIWGSNTNISIANVQIYNTSLSNSSIKALYDEGIGGSPIDLQYLVGWWPLNGNANDYSGNNNNGVPTNVIFTGTWQSGYAAP
jgi:hypothetical protein